MIVACLGDAGFAVRGFRKTEGYNLLLGLGTGGHHIGAGNCMEEAELGSAIHPMPRALRLRSLEAGKAIPLIAVRQSAIY